MSLFLSRGSATGEPGGGLPDVACGISAGSLMQADQGQI